MKKIILSTILCLILCICSFGLIGCKEANFTKENIDELYSSMKTDERTSQFFKGEYFVVNFDSSRINMSSTDKSYIFPQVYNVYLQASSSLFSDIIKRVGKISSIVKSFSQEELNNIYYKLYMVKNNLLNLEESKTVFEISNGNLHYKDVLNDYNTLIKSLYDLNNTFADYYFVESRGKVDFSKEELTDGNVRDMLRYQLLKTSSVSFNYELLNFVASNPLGEINTWYNSTTILKNYITIAKSVISALNNPENLVDFAGSNKSTIKTYFANMQNQQIEYFQEHNVFIKSLNGFNVRAYFASANKTIYIQNLSYKQKSYFQIIQNFLNGRYKSYCNALNTISSYL